MYPQNGVVFEKRVENEHADRRRFTFFQGFDAKPIVGREDQLSSCGWIVAIDLIHVDEILQEQRNDRVIDAGNRLHCFFRASLYERRNPFHERFPHERVFTPAVEINESADLLA